ncbi:hypothetical protein [Sphingopyxis panaciterrulae]|uniref:Uncharacterized protein n=1 Tax=Sphingopyxis panaciterrulae TaxID=462372 RepID=A0A7W9B1U1_9SPHN|nr:hypothetical protein [Sphingopyxis panaciterrulae]MBB5704703.1 hypothetical protein [Sphingopyxis panaciterrulae]
MGMLNNWDVGGGVSDFWDYIRQPRPHRWTSWGVAVVLALVVFWGFGKYLIPYEKPKPQIIYFENWKADRSEAEVRADWIARAKETTRENARRRAEYQKLADMMGVPYDSSKADEVTRETLGKEADTLIAKKPEPPKRSTLAERAARGPKPAAEGPTRP